jgi:uncharacterized protein (DUF952 family)
MQPRSESIIMGFHVEINSILRTDEPYELIRGREHPFEKTGSRVFFDDIPIWLTANDWTARAEIRVISQTRDTARIRGTFRVLHAYDPVEATPITRVFRRMFAGGPDPLIHLLMNTADFQSAQKAGTWDPRKPSEPFIHASPADKLTRVANKHYSQFAEVIVASLRAERIRSRIEWEPASDQALYPHVYGPINFDAMEKYTVEKKGPDGLFSISAAR